VSLTFFVFKASPRRRQVVAALPSGGRRGASAGAHMASALAAMASIRQERRPSDAKARNPDAVRELCRI
jgi:hypothetical protein